MHAYMYTSKWKTCISTLHFLPTHSHAYSMLFFFFFFRAMYASQIRGPRNRYFYSLLFFFFLIAFHSMDSQGHFLRLLWQGAPWTPIIIYRVMTVAFHIVLLIVVGNIPYSHWYRPYKTQKPTYGEESVPFFRMLYIFWSPLGL